LTVLAGGLVALALAGGCTSDTTLSSSVRVTCGEETPCPPGFVCNPAGRCERADALDREPPGIEGPVDVTPVAGGVGTRFSVTFLVGERLIRPPEVLVDLGARHAPLEAVALDGRRHTYAYVATGGEPEGRRELGILLVDESGNEHRDTSASLSMDFTPPRLVGEAVLDRQAVGDGAACRLTFHVSEPLPEALPPEVRFTDGRMWALLDRPDGGYRYEYVASEAEDPAGAVRVELHLEDAAGNGTPAVDAGTVTFDYTAPRVVRQAVDPPAVRQGAALDVFIEVDEALGAVPSLRSSGEPPLELGQPEQVGHTWRWVREVTAADPEGVHGLVVDLEDPAGNAASVEIEGGLRIDRTPPGIVPASVVVASGRLLASGDELALALRVSEPLSEAPRVLLGARELVPTAPPDAPEGDDQAFGYRYVVRGGPEDGGVFGLVAELVDEAGNRHTDSRGLGQVELDFAPPQYEAVLSPALAGRGDVVAVTVSAREELSEPPFVELRRLPGGVWTTFDPLPEASGGSTTFSRAVGGEGGLAEGRYALRVHLRDLAGNVVDGAALDTELEVDATPPVVLPAGTPVAATCPDPDRPDLELPTGTHVRTGSRVVIRFRTSEAPAPGSLDVRVGDTAAVREGESDAPFVFRLDVPAWGGRDGPVPVTVTLEDAAGNRTAHTLDTLSRDDTSPGLAGQPVLQRVDLYPPAHVAPDEVHARAGSVVRVSFAVDEPTRLRPRVLVAGTTSAPDDWEEGDTTFQVEVLDPGVEGAAAVEARITDRAGNTEPALWLGTVRYDYRDPAPPDTRAAGRVVYERVPWGSDATDGRPAYWVRSEPGAVVGEGTVVVHDSEDGLGSVLGSGSVAPDGSFGPIALVPADHPVVFVQTADLAGNLSLPEPVRDVEWVATLGRKQPGSRLDNPHAVVGQRWAADHLANPEGVEAAGAPLAQRDDGRLVTLGGGRWRLANTGDPAWPSGRSWHVLSADTARNRLVLFSGQDREDELWERDGDARWWDLACGGDTTCEGPPATSGHAQTYDTMRGRVVLIDHFHARTWEWDGHQGSWQLVCDPEAGCVGPAARQWESLVFDAARGRAVFHYGMDTWEWDGLSRRWTRVGSTGPDRESHALAYDLHRERVLMFGGTPLSTMELSDALWEWDGRARRWVQVCGDGTDCHGPPARRSALLAYDVHRGKAVLFGGMRGARGAMPLADTWEWDSTSRDWTQTCDPAAGCAGPSAADGAALAWDPGRRVVVLHGGQSDGVTREATWEYDGRRWQRVQGEGVAEPALGAWASPAWDAGAGRLVLHALDDLGRGQTWEWDPSFEVWEQVCGHPGDCRGPNLFSQRSLVHVPELGASLLFGNTETWAWNSAERTWSPVCGPGTACDNPRLPGSVRAVWDGLRDLPMVVTDHGEVWELDPLRMAWSGVCVRQAHCGLREARRDPAAAWVPGAGKDGLLLYGMAISDSPLTEWRDDEGGWAELQPADGVEPEERWTHDVVADLARRTLLLFGGSGSQWDFGDTWEWRPDPGTWVEVCDGSACRAPTARSAHSLTWDPAARRAILYGGDGGGNETWAWTHASERPAQQATFERFSKRAGDSEWLERIELRAYSGGRGELDGKTVHGAELLLWDQGRYRLVAQNAAAPEAPGPLSWQTTDATVLDRLLRFSERQTQVVTLRTAGENGRGTATLATDYLELRVRYRRGPAPDTPCDPLGDGECERGACYPDADWRSGVCAPEGTVEAGRPCQRDVSCASGHVCAYAEDREATCRRLCDRSDADPGCPAATVCAPWGETLGVCVEAAGP